MKKILLSLTVPVLSISPMIAVSCYDKKSHTEVENFEMFVRKMPKIFRANDLIDEYYKKVFTKNIEEHYDKFNKYLYNSPYPIKEYGFYYRGIIKDFVPSIEGSTKQIKKIAKKYLTNFGDKDYYADVKFIVLNKWQNSKKSLENLFLWYETPITIYGSTYNVLNEKEFKEWTKFIDISNLKECQSYKKNNKIYVKNLLVNIRLVGWQDKTLKDYLVYIDIEC